jgi:hypothetical protein
MYNFILRKCYIINPTQQPQKQNKPSIMEKEKKMI